MWVRIGPRNAGSSVSKQGSSMPAPLLELQNLQKYFPVSTGALLRRKLGWVKAVDGVDIAIYPGETLGLIGESGCGKTTTSKLILLQEAPTSGTIRFDGEDISTLGGKELMRYRREVQVVFQDPYSSLSPRMRVGDIIAEPLEIHTSLSRQELDQRVAEVLELADSLELCGKPLHPYTHALFTAALPSHPDERHERLTITGEVPSALDPPSGCRFHPRCPHAMPQCAIEAPIPKEVAPHHTAACHLY